MPRMPCSDIDRHIGIRIRKRRRDYMISMAALGAAIGVSGQQIHKYEMGPDKISAAKLYAIAHELQVPMVWFFDGD